jgi:hypothetical protein
MSASGERQMQAHLGALARVPLGSYSGCVEDNEHATT